MPSTRMQTPLGDLVFEPVDAGCGHGGGASRGTGPAGRTSSEAGGTARMGAAGHRRPVESAGAGGYTANGQVRADRAAQFMPFAALTGYYEIAREQERVVEPKHELTEDEALSLSRIMLQVKKGDLVRVEYYERDGYRSRVGVVSAVKSAHRRLVLGSASIPFDDIRALERRAAGERV